MAALDAARKRDTLPRETGAIGEPARDGTGKMRDREVETSRERVALAGQRLAARQGRPQHLGIVQRREHDLAPCRKLDFAGDVHGRCLPFDAPRRGFPAAGPLAVSIKAVPLKGQRPRFAALPGARAIGKQPGAD